MNTTLIAACGMNCGICIGYLRDKNKCPGCRLMGIQNASQSNKTYCKKCIIKNCPNLKEKKMKFCSHKCDTFPCKRLKNLDKRYQTRYSMSMIENLEKIDKTGIREFVKNEKIRWKCKKCGNTLCVHRETCLFCGAKR